MSNQKIKHVGCILGLSASFTDSSEWKQIIPGPVVDDHSPLGPAHQGMALEQGVNVLHLPGQFHDWLEAAQGWLTIQRRHELEQDPTVRQILPYTVIMLYNQDEPHLPPQFFCYQRGKGIGESRLLGDWSIGAGGHIDLADVVFDPKTSAIDLQATITQSLVRELVEELEFRDRNGNEHRIDKDPALFSVHPHSFIRDDSNAVGQVHLGVVNIVVVPHDWTIRCREAELLTGEPGTAPSLLARGLKFENWSQMLLETLADIGKVVKARPRVNLQAAIDSGLAALDGNLEIVDDQAA